MTGENVREEYSEIKHKVATEGIDLFVVYIL
jgi:hypothetical protein